MKSMIEHVRENWKSILLMSVVCVLVGGLVAGCAPFLEFIGVTTDPVTGETTNEGGGGTAGLIANLFFPGLGGAVMSGIAGLVADVKRRKWRKIAEAGIRGVNEARSLKDKDGKIDEKFLLEQLAKYQDKEKIREKAQKETWRIEGKVAA